MGLATALAQDEGGAAFVFDLLFPKATPTATPTPLPTLSPVGGIALDADLRSLPLETADPDSAPWFAIVAPIAGLVTLGGATWHARRQRV